MSQTRSTLLDCLILLCLASFLIAPLFSLNYLDNWSSIESTFIAQGRLLGEHLPHPGWQPLWYCGTRTDYIYPPALLYGTALISRLAHIPPVRAYHIYIAIFYVLGVLAVYWMVRIGSRSRGSAWLASAATALISPSFLFLTEVRHDSPHWVPQHLHTLMAWGEGPHVSALCILPAALGAAFLALRTGKPLALAAAAVLCAFVVATNFYGATTLAILFPIMVWSVWVGERSPRVWLRAAAIVALAYGLSAFWLTPSYLRVTLRNLKLVSPPGTLSSLIVMLAALALCGALTWRFGAGKPEREWTSFVAVAAIILGVYVLGFYYFGFTTIGDPKRLVSDLDLALILAGVETVRILWKRPRLRIACTVLVMLAFLPAVRYLTHAWSPFPKSPPLENVYEYQIATWVHDHLPGERVLPSGAVRFWFDVWYDNAQTVGGSDQGMLNQMIPVAGYQILAGDSADAAVLWLQALGTDAVIAAGPASPDPYHDYRTPQKFRGLPVLYDDRHDTVIYRIPRIHPGIARVVDGMAIGRLAKFHGGDDVVGLTKYVTLVEDPAQNAATLIWRGFDEAEIEAKTEPGQSVLIQETWDPAWHAYENGKELPVSREDKMDFTLIDAPQGQHKIRMRFETPLENRAGQVLFVLTAIVLAGIVIRR